MKYSEFYTEFKQLIQRAEYVGKLRAEILDADWHHNAEYDSFDGEVITFRYSSCGCCTDYLGVPTKHLDLSDEELKITFQNEKTEMEDWKRFQEDTKRQAEAEAKAGEEKLERDEYERLHLKYGVSNEGS